MSVGTGKGRRKMAAIHMGLAEESFKLCVGHDIFQNDGSAYDRKTWQGTAARGMSEAFQVILKSAEPALLTLDEQTVFHRKGMLPVYRLAADCPLPVTLRHVGMVTGDDQLRYGDILLGNPAAELEAGTPAAVYIEVEVPYGMPAGAYTGTLCLYRSLGFSGEEKTETLSFGIEVFDYDFPAPENRRFYLDLWQHPASIARKAEVPLWSDRHFSLLEPYLRLLADLGQRAITAIVSEIPWCGQAGFMERRCTTDLYEYSMIRVFRRDEDVYKRQSLEYTPTEVAWSHDRILLGYGNNGRDNGTLTLEMFGEGKKLRLKKKVDGQETVLAEADMTYTANTTYEIHVSVNALAGKAAVSIAPVGGTAVELNVKDAFIKTLKGDIGFSSWGGNYMVDNMTVTAYGIVLPGSDASKPGDSSDGSHGSVDTGVALPMFAIVLLFGAAAVLLLLNWKSKRVHNG